jgi:hypothetical protein
MTRLAYRRGQVRAQALVEKLTGGAESAGEALGWLNRYAKEHTQALRELAEQLGWERVAAYLGAEGLYGRARAEAFRAYSNGFWSVYEQECERLDRESEAELERDDPPLSARESWGG